MDIDKKMREMERIANMVVVHPGLINMLITACADQAEIEYFKKYQAQYDSGKTFTTWVESEEFSTNAPTIKMVLGYVGETAPLRLLTAVDASEFDLRFRAYEADALGFCLFEVEVEMREQ